MDEVKKKKPKVFLEVGVFHGVTARNVCELLSSIHKDEFQYVGVDLFEESYENENEVIPNTHFSNPLKRIYFNYIKRQNPYSKKAVEDLLKKFEENVSLIQGNSNKVLKKIDMSKVDYDLSYAPGVKQAIDEFVGKNNFNCKIICNNRFAKIEKH